MVYRFYCMALFHSQTRRHMINVLIMYESVVDTLLLELSFDSFFWFMIFVIPYSFIMDYILKDIQ